MESIADITEAGVWRWNLKVVERMMWHQRRLRWFVVGFFVSCGNDEYGKCRCGFMNEQMSVSRWELESCTSHLESGLYSTNRGTGNESYHIGQTVLHCPSIWSRGIVDEDLITAVLIIWATGCPAEPELTGAITTGPSETKMGLIYRFIEMFVSL